MRTAGHDRHRAVCGRTSFSLSLPHRGKGAHAEPIRVRATPHTHTQKHYRCTCTCASAASSPCAPPYTGESSAVPVPTSNEGVSKYRRDGRRGERAAPHNRFSVLSPLAIRDDDRVFAQCVMTSRHDMYIYIFIFRDVVSQICAHFIQSHRILTRAQYVGSSLTMRRTH